MEIMAQCATDDEQEIEVSFFDYGFESVFHSLGLRI